ncbi:hypothetical protein BS47DRAFT_53992 [Hydnum rufescens UP504]|uniref:Uncharacterized protein n=1 Tax=Hydnum rufescens UP504 TaxID=1448309 RepID=A0A9P6DUG9_9AGAM|nr:hypothetical protein BS47DRAFT_53992 [Hydnum rufescens UP504]
MCQLDFDSLLGQSGPTVIYSNVPKVHLTDRNGRGRPHPRLARNVLVPSNSTTLVSPELSEVWRRVGFHSLTSVLEISFVPVCPCNHHPLPPVFSFRSFVCQLDLHQGIQSSRKAPSASLGLVTELGMRDLRLQPSMAWRHLRSAARQSIFQAKSTS